MPKQAKENDRLRKIVEAFSKTTVTVMGDLVADEFVFGEISRVSREAPVLILRHRQTEVVPGGGANAANNLVELGARVFPVTVVGDDTAGAALASYFRAKRIDHAGILQVKGWTTPTKTRFLAAFAHTVSQQVLRMDREPHGALPESVRKKLRATLASRLRRADALAISDYGFGVASPDAVRESTRAARRPIPVTLDSRFHLHDYAKAGLTSATARIIIDLKPV